MLKKLALAGALCCALVSAAVAGTTQTYFPTTGAYTDLGAGPLQVENQSANAVMICVGDSLPSPSTICHVLRSGAPVPYPFPTGSHLYAQALGGSATVVVSPLQATVQDNTVASAIVAAALTPPVQIRAQSVLVTDLSSTAIASTGNGSTLPLDSGSTYSAIVNVSAVSGTNPTLDLILQESADGGVTWNDIYHLQRITAAGTVTVPNMLLTGTRRWKWTVGGTASPSFTTSIIATRGTGAAPLIRQFYDRTVNANSLGSASPTWNIAGVKSAQMFVLNGAVTTTAAVWQLQFSPDGTNFTNAGSTVNPGNNGTATTNTANMNNYVRIGVITAGSGDTVSYVHFFGTN